MTVGAVGQGGFAIVTALVIVTLSLVTLSASAAVLVATRGVSVGDARGDEVRETLNAGLAEACDRLRWSWPSVTSSAPQELATTTGEYDVSISRLSGADHGDEQTYGVVVTVCSATVKRTLSAEVAVKAGGLPLGVCVGGDIRALAPLMVQGSGIYAGGGISGGEWLWFEAPLDWAGGPVPDGVAATVWPEAAAHAYAASDYLAAVSQPMTPSPESLAALRAHSAEVGPAMLAGCLNLGLLPLHVPVNDPLAPASGLLIVVDATDLPTGLKIQGSRPLLACPVTLVVIGDAVVDESEATPLDATVPPASLLTGGLVVTGTLRCERPFALSGHLYAGELDVRSSLKVSLPPNWRANLVAGYCAVSIQTLSE